MSADVFERLAAAVETLLTTDPEFIAELTGSQVAGGCGLPRAPGSVMSGRAINQVHVDHMPAFLLEPAATRSGAIPGLTNDPLGMVIGGGQQAMRKDLAVSLVWSEQDLDRAKRTRLRLEGAFVRLFLRNPDAGVVDCAQCVVTAMEPDQGARHPTQIFNVILTADIVVYKET